MNEVSKLLALREKFESLRNETAREPEPRRVHGEYYPIHENEQEKQFRLGRCNAYAHASAEVTFLLSTLEPATPRQPAPSPAPAAPYSLEVAPPRIELGSSV